MKKKENNSSIGYIAPVIVIDTLLIIYFIVYVLIRYFTTKVYADIFIEYDYIKPLPLLGIISNGLIVFLFLCVYVCMTIEEYINKS